MHTMSEANVAWRRRKEDGSLTWQGIKWRNVAHATFQLWFSNSMQSHKLFQHHSHSVCWLDFNLFTRVLMAMASALHVLSIPVKTIIKLTPECQCFLQILCCPLSRVLYSILALSARTLGMVLSCYAFMVRAKHGFSLVSICYSYF